MIAATICLIALAQFPSVPDKTPPVPQKSTPLSSPQASLATPQAAQADYGDSVPVQSLVLRVPSSYIVQRQIVVRQAAPAYDVAPAVCDTGMSLAYAGQGCGVQAQAVQRSFVQHNVVVSHGIQQQVVVNHAISGGRQPKKVVTKQVTKTKRGLFGGLFGR